MKILDSIEELSALRGPIVLVAGTFDGVHLGHQALIRRALSEASACGGTAVVMTFDRHPASLLRPGVAPRLLTRNDEKIILLEGIGVSNLLMLEFTKELSAITASNFVDSLDASCTPLHALCVGSEWSFGKGGEGNVDLLKEIGSQRGFSVIRIDPIQSADVPISSTRIRAAIAKGDLSDAALCLGRPFLLTGTVVPGAGLGATIGFPTANLDVSAMQLPPDGVYAVKALIDGSNLTGVCNIGLRPTVDASGKNRTVEVHLFDFCENLVGCEISLEFVKFLRGERKFACLEELKKQIGQDCDSARANF